MRRLTRGEPGAGRGHTLEPMAEHSAAVRQVHGSDGTRIVYRADGPAGARPLILVHGWAQSSACWGPNVLAALTRQYRVIALDLRGHGYSGAPEDAYNDPSVWAGDLRAVFDAEGIGPGAGAVLLGWSYGGLVCCDFLDNERGAVADGTVGGLILVGALTGIGRGQKGGRVGKAMRAAMPAVLATDAEVAVPAMITLTSAFHSELYGKGEREQALLALALATPPRVRTALFNRNSGHDEMLAGLDIPVLVMHGTADRIVDPSAAEHAVATIPQARPAFWDGGGHAPFVENEGRFISEIDEFIDVLDAGPPAAASAGGADVADGGARAQSGDGR